MPFADLLSRERIVRVGALLDRDGVLEHVAALLSQPVGGQALPTRDMADRLRQRERLASTALGHGVAIPHARIPGLDRARAAFLLLERPVAFAAADSKPVDWSSQWPCRKTMWPGISRTSARWRSGSPTPASVSRCAGRTTPAPLAHRLLGARA